MISRQARHPLACNMRQVYFNGLWIPESQVAIGIHDAGFTLGVTVTERLRTFEGRLFRRAEHLARLRSSLEIIGLAADEITAEIGDAVDEYIDRHREQRQPGDDWAVVAFVTPGEGDKPTTCVHGLPLPFGQWADQFEVGTRLYTSDHRQVPPSCWPAELKCRSRMHYFLADQQARRRDPQARGLLLDQEGFVGEGSTANIAIVDARGNIATPLYSKVLPGVSMAVIEELSPRIGVGFAQRDLALAEVYEASEVWLTSTSICALPVVAVDDRPIANGRPGPLHGRLLAAWGDMVGVDIIGQAKRMAAQRAK